MAESFINPDKVELTGAIAGGVITAMTKTPHNQTCVLVYNPAKAAERAYSVHTLDCDDKSLSHGDYGMSFQDAVISFAQRATLNSNIKLVH